MRDCLRGLGYGVAGIAASSESAIQMLETHKPQMVLISTRLKGSGLDAIQTGTLVGQLHDLPVIYVIDRSSQATIRRAGTAGSFGYVFRPFDVKQIHATIEIGLIRHQLERKLEQSRQWLDITLTSIGDGVIATDGRGVVRFINPAASLLTGSNHAAAVDRPLGEVLIFVDEGSTEPVPAVDLPHFPGAAPFEGNLLSANGRLVRVEVRSTPIKDAKGSDHGNVLVLRDITRQREVTAEIRRQADRAEALVEAASQLNARQDLVTVLATICRITNRTLKAAGTWVLLEDAGRDVFQSMALSRPGTSPVGDPVDSFEIPVDDLRHLLSPETPVITLSRPEGPGLAAVFERLRSKTLVLAGLYQRDKILGALISGFRENGHPLGEDEIALLQGLADQASSAIKNASLFEQVRAGRERQRELARSLVEIQEAERQHIAQELHDQLGQHLTGLQFMLETTKNQSIGEQRTALQEIQDTVRDVIGEVREMSLGLRPSMLDDMGLLTTLRWHFARYTSQTGIRVTFESAESTDRFPAQIEITAYRIIQEALTNAGRHAGVDTVFVGLVVHDNTLWVEVLDKGRGFDSATQAEQPSSGLGGMRERAALADGYLTVRSFVGQGTQVVAALPLNGRPLERRRHDRDHLAG